MSDKKINAMKVESVRSYYEIEGSFSPEQSSISESIKSSNSKKKLKCECKLISMCLITLVSNCAYALIAPFLPLELIKAGIPMHLFGYIFSTYSLAVIICSPMVGYFLTKVRRRNLV